MTFSFHHSDFSSSAQRCVVVAARWNRQAVPKDGLVFDYPAGWTLKDSDRDAQRLTLASEHHSLFVHRGQVRRRWRTRRRASSILRGVDWETICRNGAKPHSSSDSTDPRREAEGLRSRESCGEAVPLRSTGRWLEIES